MKLDVTNSWIVGARRVISPNCDARPACTDIDLVVIHAISVPPAEFGGPWIDALFTNNLVAGAHPSFAAIADLRVSAHVLIRRDGELVQYVPFGKRAWHAGDSSFAGRPRCNDYAIGIELEGADDIAYEDAQYAVLARLNAALMAVWPGIGAERIVGHNHIAPQRKTDPGVAFDWNRFRGLLRRVRETRA